MKTVFVVQHVHEIDEDNEDVKLIGVYSSMENAKKSVERLKLQPGFSETQEGFNIEKYTLNKDHWIDGYVTL